MERIFTFKEITTREALETAFRLRYDVYLNSPNKVVITENSMGLDIDCYDEHSKHYCLMNNEDQAGYFRIVFPAQHFTNEIVHSITNQVHGRAINEKTQQKEKAPYPFLSYKEIPESYRNYFYALAECSKVIECSRLIVAPKYRTVRSSFFLTEAALALYVVVFTDFKQAIINCPIEHSCFYKNMVSFQLPTKTPAI